MDARKSNTQSYTYFIVIMAELESQVNVNIILLAINNPLVLAVLLFPLILVIIVVLCNEFIIKLWLSKQIK